MREQLAAYINIPESRIQVTGSNCIGKKCYYNLKDFKFE